MSIAPPQSHPQYGVTQLIYALHALSLVIGIIGTQPLSARSCLDGRRSSP
jgi:hypothetical protein